MSLAIDKLTPGVPSFAPRAEKAVVAPSRPSLLSVGAATDAASRSLLIAKSLGLTVIDELKDAVPSPEFVEKIPISFARQYGLLGLSAVPASASASSAGTQGEERGGGWNFAGPAYQERDKDRLVLAVRDLTDYGPIEIVARFLGRPVQPVLTTAAEIASAINHAYQQRTGQTQALIERMDRRDVLAEVEAVAARDDLLDVATRAPVIKLVSLILFEAAQARASDVHVQPYEESLVVRLRIDGVLYDSFTVPKAIQEEVISRIKVMGRMNIAEKRLPQDGRATVQVGDRSIDLRIATLPTTFGERAVIRLLDKGSRLYTATELGMEPSTLDRFRSLISSEHGIILVTGPTGSGKTTTLYAALREIDSKQRNILTLEDPIEYRLEGISQTQVSEKKGMTFASGLRSVLRQDPDIIMVGEIRDHETAVMAIQSALTGHLVFSTLHTNDAASAITRLLDLGIEPYLLASSVIGVLAQRLVRRVCPDCARRANPSNADMARLGLESTDASSISIGAGCEACRRTGYRGRSGIFELLTVDDTIRRQVQTRGAATEVKAAAIAAGMRTLRDDGVAKVLGGLTTIDEVLRVTMGDAS